PVPGAELAPAHLALAHGRRVALRARARGTPRDERRSARAERGARLPRARASDGRDLARGVRGGALRAAPAAGRVGGADRRAQGRALDRVRPGRPVRVVVPSREREPARVRDGARTVRGVAARQADARDLPVPPPRAGLVAAPEAGVAARAGAAR